MAQRHRNNCKICGKYSGKSDTCKKCKKKYPPVKSEKGSKPFNRKELFEKENKKKK